MMKKIDLSQINSVFSRLRDRSADKKCHFSKKSTAKLMRVALAIIFVFNAPLPSYAKEKVTEKIEELVQVKAEVAAANEKVAAEVKEIVEVTTEVIVERAVERVVVESQQTNTPINLTPSEKKEVVRKITRATVTYMFQMGLFKDEISRIITHKLPVTAAAAVIVSTTTMAAGALISLVMPALGDTIAAIPFGAVTVIGMLPFETFSRWLKSKRKYGYSYAQLDKFNRGYMGYESSNNLGYYSVTAGDGRIVLPVEGNALKLTKKEMHRVFINKLISIKDTFFQNKLDNLNIDVEKFLSRKVLIKILNNDTKRLELLKKAGSSIPIYHGLLIAEIQKNEDKFKELVSYSVSNSSDNKSEYGELLLQIKVLKQRMSIVLENTAVSKLTIPFRLQRTGLVKFEKAGYRSYIKSHISKRKELISAYNSLVALTYDTLYSVREQDQNSFELAQQNFSKIKETSLVLIPEVNNGYRLAANKKRNIVEAPVAISAEPSCAISLLKSF